MVSGVCSNDQTVHRKYPGVYQNHSPRNPRTQTSDSRTSVNNFTHLAFFVDYMYKEKRGVEHWYWVN